MRRDDPFRRSLLWLGSAFCVLGVITISTIFCAGCASSSLGTGLNVALVGSSTWDYVETRKAITEGRGAEANPVLGQGAIRQALIKAAGTSGVLAVAHLLELKGRPVLAHVVRGVVTSLFVYAAIHNRGGGTMSDETLGADAEWFWMQGAWRRSQGPSDRGPGHADCGNQRVDRSRNFQREGRTMSVTTKPENPPAFPVLTEFEQFDDKRGKYVTHMLPADGMTLRDYFAAKAMQAVGEAVHGVFCCVDHDRVDHDQLDHARNKATDIARMAFIVADAMLKERGTQP